jgi:hypothetical protein
MESLLTALLPLPQWACVVGVVPVWALAMLRVLTKWDDYRWTREARKESASRSVGIGPSSTTQNDDDPFDGFRLDQ